MKELDLQSTPGCCSLSHLGTTNGAILGWDGVKFNDERVEFLRGAVFHRFTELHSGNPVADPLNVFIKREPIKMKKEKSGAYRLISGVSLIDNMVDRILFGWLNRAAVATVLDTPSMIGWSPLRGGWRYIARKFVGKPVVCLDKSAWDWTVLEWMVKDFLEFLFAIAINPPQWWKDMARLRFELLYKTAVFKFGDGTTVHQNEWGIQKSGCLLTIIFNTVLQIMLHHRVSDDSDEGDILALGDDTTQTTPPDVEEYVARVEALGPKIKEVKEQHWVEFAGFAYYGMTCVPAYWKKHLFNLKYSTTPVETMQAYQVLYSHDPAMSEFLEQELLRFGPEVVFTRQWSRFVMDSS